VAHLRGVMPYKGHKVYILGDVEAHVARGFFYFERQFSVLM
jgi:hypothetical protein